MIYVCLFLFVAGIVGGIAYSKHKRQLAAEATTKLKEAIQAAEHKL